MKFPISENWFSFIGIFVLFILIIYIIWLGLTRMNDLFRKKKKNNKSNEKKYDYSCFGCLFKFLLIAIVFWFGVSLIAISALTQSYYRFTDQKFIAEVMCEPTSFQNYTMRFTITMRDGKQSGITQTFYLKGERWFIEGDILKWQPWVNFAGLNTMYRLSTIGSDYMKTEDRLTKDRSIENLESDLPPHLWQWLHKYGHLLNVIQGVYYDNISTPPEKNRKFKIFVTTSGFSMETVNVD
jgi:hypothetical protein